MAKGSDSGVSLAGLVTCNCFLMLNLDFEAAVGQEEARLRLLHPTPSDIPGCLSTFDDYLSCSRKRLCFWIASKV